MEPAYLFSAKHLGYLVFTDSRVELTQMLPLPRWACDRCAIAAIRSFRQRQCDGIRVSTVYGDYFVSFTDERIISRPARGRPVEMAVCRMHDTPPDASIYLYIADPFWYPRHASTLFYARAVVDAQPQYRLPALRLLGLPDSRLGSDRILFDVTDILKRHMKLVARWAAGCYDKEMKERLTTLSILREVISGDKKELNITETGVYVLMALGSLYKEELMKYVKSIKNFEIQIKALFTTTFTTAHLTL